MTENRRRVAVTGMGIICPVGNDPDQVWASILNKRCGIRTIEGLDLQGYKVSLAGLVRDEDIQTDFSKRELKFNDRFVRMARIAARQAMVMSGFVPEQPEEFGVLIASGIGGLSTIEKNHDTLQQRGPGRISPYFIPMSLINLAAGQVAIDVNAQGTVQAVVTACAASTNAIGEAFHRIRDGYETAILAGGCEAPVTALGVAGFQSMKALHTENDPDRASIPFDEERSGFVMAEGAAVLLLEEYDHARNRGAEILAEVVGYGTTCDAFHITAPHPEGKGARRAMEKALEDAGLEPDQVDCINAHGTSTRLNDAAEMLAVQRVFTGHMPYMSSTKSYTGHMLGASGAAESVICIESMQHNLVPTTLNTRHTDSGTRCRIVTGNHQPASLNYVMNNSFGFGGHNASLIFARGDRNADL
ncbi:beta-ketoacyl-ACP synthase II [Faecalibaculum rodentium]|jgi:3-oxoacyl-[acyl-carrier-protein] synthase II|uniref:beta-ketoacyl-ACP synthase II n=2 Tax=Faecalibaculum rodentium TaxID=1702221 RepID=UPI00256F5FB3|nr:beta-ketoacyl-ACP synthase II [Faecalibaculum rodentium]